MENRTEGSLYSFLSIMQRAGKLQSGEMACELAVKAQKAFLVIVALDASDNTKKLFSNKCDYYKVPYVEFGKKEDLGHAIGKRERSSVAIIDEGFAKSFLKKLENLKQTQEESN